MRRQPELGPVYDEEDALASTLSLMWIQFMEGRTDPRTESTNSCDSRTIIGRRIAAKGASCGPPSDPHRPTRTPTVDSDFRDITRPMTWIAGLLV